MALIIVRTIYVVPYYCFVIDSLFTNLTILVTIYNASFLVFQGYFLVVSVIGQCSFGTSFLAVIIIRRVLLEIVISLPLFVILPVRVHFLL